MSRLPVVDGDSNAWGSILNDFLSVSLNPDGTLKVTPLSNPMTNNGDMIYGSGPGGTPTRLPAGANGQNLVFSGGIPTWVNALGIPLNGPASNQPTVWQQFDGSILVIPLATYGISNPDDAVWINNAFTFLPSQLDNDLGSSYTVGTVRLLPAIYSLQSQVVIPPKVNLIGSGVGTWLNAIGPSFSATNAVLFSHYTNVISGTVQHKAKRNSIRDFLIDGTGTSAAVSAIDVGDGWGINLHNIWIQNFTQSGSIGLSVCNRNFWTEKLRARGITIMNCDTHAKFWHAVAATSHEYNDFEFYLWTQDGQTGVTYQGVLANGSLKMRGNFAKDSSPGSNWVLGFIHDSVNVSDCTVTDTFDISMEPSGSGTIPTFLHFGDVNQQVGPTAGYIRVTNGGSDSPNNNAQKQFIFRGGIQSGGDSYSSVTAPTAPATGVQVTNVQHDCTAYLSVSGGTITSIIVEGTNVGGNGQTYVPVDLPYQATIKVNYSGTLTWVWVGRQVGNSNN